MDFDYADIAGLVDHALLDPRLDRAALDAGVELARTYGVASVCAVPHYLPRAVELLAGSAVRATSTVGFPHGSQATAVKVAEAERALADGAVELDAVVNVSRVLSADWDYVRRELALLVELVHARAAKIKLIFENAYLERSHKLELCAISAELGADWVKTSTGFGPGGATLADVALMREASPPSVGVKASGGIRDLDALLELRPYVTRVGTSSTARILDECRGRVHRASGLL